MPESSKKFWRKEVTGLRHLNVPTYFSLDDTLFHIKWEQTTDKPFYKRLNFSRYKQMVNHLLAHECITSKSGLL